MSSTNPIQETISMRLDCGPTANPELKIVLITIDTILIPIIVYLILYELARFDRFGLLNRR